MSNHADRLPTETAHLLGADIVGFSARSHEEQERLKRAFNQIVKETGEFQLASEAGNVLWIDTGDGCFLVFFRDPTSPLRCAEEIAVALRDRADLPLRMGIHSGVIVLTRDVNDKPNVIGEGINTCERVMSAGDSGHILLSEFSAGQLLTFDKWQPRLHRLGEFRVKHNSRLVLYSFHDAAVGNAALPSKMASPSEVAPKSKILKPVPPQEEMRTETARAVGGAVGLGSMLYVARQTDAQFLKAIEQQESIALIKGARQMGKSSLLARGLHKAREQGARVVLTDFQEFSRETLEQPSAHTLLLALAHQLSAELDLPTSPDAFWNPKLDANTNLRSYLNKGVLSAFPEPLVWGMDEVDRLFAYPYAEDFFSLIRVIHNRRASYPNEHWARLTFAIAHSTEPSLFITEQSASPFNVGVHLPLKDFTPQEAQELNSKYHQPLQSQEQEERLYQLVAGQPYLTSRALYEISENGLAFETLIAEADQDTGVFGDHLRRLFAKLTQDTTLAEIVRCVLQNKSCTDAKSFYRLRSAGILLGESARNARIRCPLYASYFRKHLP